LGGAQRNPETGEDAFAAEHLATQRGYTSFDLTTVRARRREMAWGKKFL
jgi:hypothetical protein